MKLVNTYITIGNLEFDFVNSIEVDSSWMDLTDTCELKLPSNLKLNKNTLKDLIKKGDQVLVQVGYDNALQTVFEGYLTDIKPSTPIELRCEDLMWKIKQTRVNRNFPGGKLIDFLQEVLPGIEIDSFDIEISSFRASNISGAKLLDSIKGEFGLQCFIRNNQLVVGKRYDPDNASEHVFKIDFNMVSDDLEYRAKEDVRLLVKAISNNEDGTKTEIELGDPDGDQNTLNFYNLSKEELRKLATRELDRLKYDGWRGSFVAFGEPIVKHGDIATLIHEDQSDKTGQYYIDGAVTSSGVNGLRQTIKLGARA